MKARKILVSFVHSVRPGTSGGRAGSAAKQSENGSSATVNPWAGASAGPGQGSESERLERAKSMNVDDVHDLVRGVRWRQQQRGSTDAFDTRSNASLVSRPGTGTGTRPQN